MKNWESDCIWESEWVWHVGVYKTLSDRKCVRVKIWVWACKDVIKTKSACEVRGWEKGIREHTWKGMWEKTRRYAREWEMGRKETGDGDEEWEVWEIICEK